MTESATIEAPPTVPAKVIHPKTRQVYGINGKGLWYGDKVAKQAARVIAKQKTTAGKRTAGIRRKPLEAGIVASFHARFCAEVES